LQFPPGYAAGENAAPIHHVEQLMPQLTILTYVR
jgi:hypothetical protein